MKLFIHFLGLVRYYGIYGSDVFNQSYKFGARMREDEHLPQIPQHLGNGCTIVSGDAYAVQSGLGCLGAASTLRRSQVALGRARLPLLPEQPPAARGLYPRQAPLPASKLSPDGAVLFAVPAPLSVSLLVLLFLSCLSPRTLTPSIDSNSNPLPSDLQSTRMGCVDTSSSTSGLTWTPHSPAGPSDAGLEAHVLSLPPLRSIQV